MSRQRKYTDREIALAKLWHKLARTTYAIMDYDIYLNDYRPKLTKGDITKLKKACSQAIIAVLEKKER